MRDWQRLRETARGLFGRRTRTDWLILILIGALVLIIAIPAGELPGRDTPQKNADEEAAADEQQEDYKEQLEEQLGRLLTRVDGVGECMVMLTMADEGRIYVDKNVRNDGDSRDEETVVYRKDEGEVPCVIMERLPKVAGIVVVAEGAGNAKVVKDISDAVMSLFEIEAHKITVVKMSVQEE